MAGQVTSNCGARVFTRPMSLRALMSRLWGKCHAVDGMADNSLIETYQFWAVAAFQFKFNLWAKPVPYNLRHVPHQIGGADAGVAIRAELIRRGLMDDADNYIILFGRGRLS